MTDYPPSPPHTLIKYFHEKYGKEQAVVSLLAGIYRHYKGKHYLLIGIGEHTETGEILVSYVPLEGADLPGPRLRFRPLTGKKGWTTPEELPDGSEVPRFVYVGLEIEKEEQSGK